jgi:hypothetical protein
MNPTTTPSGVSEQDADGIERMAPTTTSSGVSEQDADGIERMAPTTTSSGVAEQVEVAGGCAGPTFEDIERMFNSIEPDGGESQV